MIVRKKERKTARNTTTSGQHPLIGVIKDQVLMIGLRAAGRRLEVLKSQRTVVALFRQIRHADISAEDCISRVFVSLEWIYF